MTSADKQEGVGPHADLIARIQRLTALVSNRSDQRSRQLRGYLNRLSTTLEARQVRLSSSEPSSLPAAEHELVLSIPPKLDLIEALVEGQLASRGSTGSAVMYDRRGRGTGHEPQPSFLAHDLEGPEILNSAIPSPEPLDSPPLGVEELELAQEPTSELTEDVSPAIEAASSEDVVEDSEAEDRELASEPTSELAPETDAELAPELSCSRI